MNKYVLVYITIIIFIISCFNNKNNNRQDYWPQDEWWKLTPEEQGLETDYFIKMLNKIKDTNDGIHSVLIIRNGYLVLDAYFYPFNSDMQHPVYSCTKSVTSALIGIAVDQGKIKNVNKKVIDYFPEYNNKIKNNDKKKDKMTIKHLLTMTSGLKWNDENDIIKLFKSHDWTKCILDMPISYRPGSHNNYNSGNSYLLSVILQKSIDGSLFDYADKYLFKPLNIQDVKWKSSPKGINIGGWGLYLKPTDMARFGYLYLKNGKWNEKQIISKKWVEESIKKHSDGTGWGLGFGYGYSWWLIQGLPYKCYEANGMYGQHITVIPDLDMVVVFTSENIKTPYNYFTEYILKSVKSDMPLQENKEANAVLNKLLDEIKSPVAEKVQNLPNIAKRISGKTYEVTGKGFNFNRISFNFDLNDRSKMKITTSINDSDKIEHFVGLDGLYRITSVIENNFTINYMAKGYWKDENTLVVYGYFGAAYRNKITILFNNDEINIVFNNINGNYFLAGKLL